MTDLLIKCMEMPKSCGECPLSYKREHYADCRILNDEEGTIKTVKRADCPLVEVKPHGDLKDANAILRWLNSKADNRVPVTVGEIIDFIEKQPTILEASATTPSRDHTCPYYQGVCGLDDDFLCYCHSRYEMCDTYKEASE